MKSLRQSGKTRPQANMISQKVTCVKRETSLPQNPLSILAWRSEDCIESAKDCQKRAMEHKETIGTVGHGVPRAFVWASDRSGPPCWRAHSVETVTESRRYRLPTALRCSPLRLISWMSCEPPSHIEKLFASSFGDQCLLDFFGTWTT